MHIPLDRRRCHWWLRLHAERPSRSWLDRYRIYLHLRRQLLILMGANRLGLTFGDL